MIIKCTCLGLISFCNKTITLSSRLVMQASNLTNPIETRMNKIEKLVPQSMIRLMEGREGPTFKSISITTSSLYWAPPSPNWVKKSRGEENPGSNGQRGVLPCRLNLERTKNGKKSVDLMLYSKQKGLAGEMESTKNKTIVRVQIQREVNLMRRRKWR